MRRSFGNSSSSLELLLDTICNMFGSIILITLLIVITTSESPMESTVVDSGPDREEIARRIKVANLQIETLQAEIQSEGSQRQLSQDQLQRLEKLQRQIALTEDALKIAIQAQTDLAERSSPLAAEKLKSLQNELRGIQAQITDIENQQAMETHRQADLKAELSKLESTRKGIKAKNTENIRLPKTRETSKRPKFVFCMHGAIYPLYLDDAAGKPHLFTGIKSREINATDTEYIPQPNEGLSGSIEKIRDAFLNLPDNRYLACYVYPDSIDAFRLLRKALENLPIEIGWDPELSGNRIILTTEKGTPAPRPQ